MLPTKKGERRARSWGTQRWKNRLDNFSGLKKKAPKKTATPGTLKKKDTSMEHLSTFCCSHLFRKTKNTEKKREERGAWKGRQWALVCQTASFGSRKSMVPHSYGTPRRKKPTGKPTGNLEKPRETKGNPRETKGNPTKKRELIVATAK